MTPSGEKTQADLSRTQYGSAPSPSKLMDAYKSMYEHHKKDADGNTIPHEGEELNEGKMPAGLQAYLDKKKGKKEDKKEVKEENIDEALPLIPLIAKGAAMLGKVGAAAGKVGAMAAKTGVKVAAKSKIPGATNVVKSVARDPMGAVDKVGRASFAAQQVGSLIPKPKMSGGGGGVSGGMTKTVTAGADLFDIVKGQLLDEGLSEEEIRDIMLTLTPDEILKEIEESSMSAGSSGGNYHDGGDGVFRSKEQIGNMFNKNIPTKKQTGGKVDKMTRKSINTSAKELGIQGPTTLKQSVEPEGETI